MNKIVIREIDIPKTNLALQSLSHIDFADSFQCQLQNNWLGDIDLVTRSIFATMPQWIANLLELRNAIVRPFGLKTSIDAEPSNERDELKPGIAVGVFEVCDRKSDEILLGEDDKHLDYRVSVRLEREEQQCWVVITTVVKFNNWLGRAYFVPVKPLHKIIVPAMMKNGLENLNCKAT